MSLSIYHNPGCSKSRATLELLNERKLNPEVVAYLDTPPSETELAQVIAKLGLAPSKLIRFGEKRAKELGLSATDEYSNDEWISLMVKNPILIERPIVITDTKAAIGRPIENVIEII